MATDREYLLPNGIRLSYMDSDSAARNIAKLLQLFGQGNEEPLIIGDGDKPEAVVIPFEQWLDLIDAADEAAADEHIRKITSERLANSDISDYVPLEEFLPPDSSNPPDRD